MIFVFCCMLSILLSAANTYAQISDCVRKAGEEILLELVTRPNKIVVRVGSKGCTDKGVSPSLQDLSANRRLNRVLTHWLIDQFIDLWATQLKQCDRMPNPAVILQIDLRADYLRLLR